MKIQCECGQFQAEVKSLPKNSPGRLACYCDDCQTFLHLLRRTDLLDSAGGTELIPVYPSEFEIKSGREHLKCTRLSPKGINRWSTKCCNTPIGNLRAGFPWFGLYHRALSAANPDYAAKFGPIRSAVQGRFAQGTPPMGTSMKMGFKDMLVVLPFLLKGFLLGKSKGSPLLDEDNVTPIIPVEVISLETRNLIRSKIGSAG